METEIGLFAMKRDMINRAIRPLHRSSGIEVHIVQMAPLALCNFVDLRPARSGAASTARRPRPRRSARSSASSSSTSAPTARNLIITDGGKIIWQRPIPIGGNHFTRALTKELKLTFAKAEHLKRNATKTPGPGAASSRRCKPVLNDFVGEVQRSLGFFTNTHRDAQIAVHGRPGQRVQAARACRSSSQRSCSWRSGSSTSSTGWPATTVIDAPLFQENLLDASPVAYGLALQGLGQARLATNLLPPEIRSSG